MKGDERHTRKGAFGKALIAIGFFCFGFLYGYLARQNNFFPSGIISFAFESIRQTHENGPERHAAGALGPGGMTEEQRLEAQRLESLNYVSGGSPAPGVSGVTVYVPRLAFDGLSYYCAGHRPEARLIDMYGKVLHSWSYDIRRLEPSLTPETDQAWIHVYLFENGDLCAIYAGGLGLIKLDKDSHLIWRYPGKTHHDLFAAEDGSLYVLTHEARIIPRINPCRPVLNDFITELSADGKLLRQVSILYAFERSDYAPLLDRMPRIRDILHTNSLRVLDGALASRSPVFARGNVLISVREIDTIAIVDMAAERVVWAASGMWRRQHQPSLLENGDMLLFDNNADHGASRVIEFEPLTGRIVWKYGGDIASGFYSQLGGSAQRLPNGNTLIVESCHGRAFEVTRDNTMVWEFTNPAREGDRNELIPEIWGMVRIRPESSLGWLARKASPEKPNAGPTAE